MTKKLVRICGFLKKKPYIGSPCIIVYHYRSRLVGRRAINYGTKSQPSNPLKNHWKRRSKKITWTECNEVSSNGQ